MRFSIITVTYNCEDTIVRTIESVLKQTFTDFEYIIIDGNSTDKTVQILENYRLSDKRIKYISETDAGIYDAMNKGIKHCSGEYIGILNSNDEYESDTLEIINKNICFEKKYQIIYGMTKIMNGNCFQEISMRSHEYLKLGTICHQSIFVSKKIYDELGVYDIRYKYVADYDFLIRVQSIKNVLFTPVFNFVVRYQAGGVSTSKEGNIEYLELMRKQGYISEKSYILQRIKIMLLGI